MDELFDSLPPEKQPILKQLNEDMEKYLKGELDLSQFKVEEWKGYRLLPAYPAETTKRIYEKLKVEENTVFVMGFPKTGINWSAEVVRQILYGHDEDLDRISKSLSPLLTFLDLYQPAKLDLLEHIALPRKMYCTHLPEELVNLDKIKKSKSKVIILVRNPKDQAVSWFHFSKSSHFDVVRDELSADWTTFFSDYVQGKHRLHTKLGEWYPDYLRGWYKHNGDESFLFLHYEDMKKDPRKEIGRLAHFMGVKLTDDRANAIAEGTSFSAMKEKTEDTQLQKLQSQMNIVRKGKVGSWKDLFTVTQSEMMDRIIKEKLGSSDVKFTYE